MREISVFLFFSITAFGALNLPSHCSYDKECVIEVPGMFCADGTRSYVTLTARKGASNLLIYLSGGGACWNRVTCSLGYANPLTRVESNLDWNNGTGIFNHQDETNPFRQNYNIVSVPYCTADVYAGNKIIDYGDPVFPYVMEHHGYLNAVRAIELAQQLFSTPAKVVLVGQSAGGIGTYLHVQTLDRYFTASPKFVVSDGGVPLRPPYVDLDSYFSVMKSWGVAASLPHEGSFIPKDFGEIIRYNKERYPHIKFGLISSYADIIMSFFAYSLGASKPDVAVRDTLIDVANNQIGSAQNAKVFYLDDSQHTYMQQKLSTVKSLDISLNDWVSSMLGEAAPEKWENVRPDIHFRVKTNKDYPAPSTIDGVRTIKSQQTILEGE